MDIELGFDFSERQGDGSLCAKCEGVIIGVMWVAVIRTSPPPEEEETDYKLCDNCYVRE